MPSTHRRGSVLLIIEGDWPADAFEEKRAINTLIGDDPGTAERRCRLLRHRGMVAAGLIDSSIGWPANIAGIPVEEIPISNATAQRGRV